MTTFFLSVLALCVQVVPCSTRQRAYWTIMLGCLLLVSIASDWLLAMSPCERILVDDFRLSGRSPNMQWTP